MTVITSNLVWEEKHRRDSTSMGMAFLMFCIMREIYQRESLRSLDPVEKFGLFSDLD